MDLNRSAEGGQDTQLPQKTQSPPEPTFSAEREVPVPRCGRTERELVQDLDQACAKIESLELALQGARTIGIAIGILVERHRIPPDEAFARLVDISQSTNQKLRLIARRLVETGQLPS